MAQKGLGAGLGALFGEDANDNADTSITLPIAKIEPRAGQPRKQFDETGLIELSESIIEHGLIQPVIVRKTDGGYYQIIAGERRWRAARMAGLSEIPARIIEADDRETAELAMVENLQREDLNPVEEARGYKALMEGYNLTQEEAAQRVGKSRPVVANSLRLLNLPDEILGKIEDGTLTLSHARAILEAPDAKIQLEAARISTEKGLTVRETAALVKRLISGEPEKKQAHRRVFPDGVDYMAEVERDMTRRMGRRVKVVQGAKRGRFEIEYYGKDDFEALRQALMQIKGETGESKDV